MIIIYNGTNINHESEFKLMKKNKLFLALMAGTIVISGCSAKSDKKEENKSAQVDTSKGTKEQLKQATELYKKFVENQVDTLLKDTEKFAETIKAGNLEEAKKQYLHQLLEYCIYLEDNQELQQLLYYKLKLSF